MKSSPAIRRDGPPGGATPIGPLRPNSNIANRAIAEKIAERICVAQLFHEPETWFDYATDEIRIALDAASRGARHL
jgi:hypothetical protein